jgi:hypothetical protein
MAVFWRGQRASDHGKLSAQKSAFPADLQQPLDSRPRPVLGSASTRLCDHGQVTCPLWVIISNPVPPPLDGVRRVRWACSEVAEKVEEGLHGTRS